MPATDSMIARLQRELEDKDTFVDGIVADAEKAQRDLDAREMEMVRSARDRIDEIKSQMEPLGELARISADSRARAAKLADQMAVARDGARVGPVEYRSAGAYIADIYLTAMGSDESRTRLEVFHRAAAHQTTTDNPGLLPEQIVAPVVQFVDSARPLVTAIGTTDLGSGAWAYAKVTQHTQVGAQSAEKAEMASRKMTITKTSITAPTYGGYVNVSKQDIQRTNPQILDMVIDDLASEYAIQTEAAAATAYTNVRGAGRLILAVAPGDLGLFGRLFAPYNPTNSQGSGFSAGSFGSGAMGAISGIQVIMTPGLAAGQALVINTAGVKLFEYRYGSLQVNEPSVWGVQVGYAGDFETVIVQTGSIISIDTAP